MATLFKPQTLANIKEREILIREALSPKWKVSIPESAKIYPNNVLRVAYASKESKIIDTHVSTLGSTGEGEDLNLGDLLYIGFQVAIPWVKEYLIQHTESWEDSR